MWKPALGIQARGGARSLVDRSPATPGGQLLVAAVTAGGAVVLGALMAMSWKLGMAAIAAAIIVPLGLRAVPAVLAIWVVSVYLGGFSGLASIPNRLGLVILGLTVVAALARRRQSMSLQPAERRFLAGFAVFTFWQLASLAWATDPSFAFEESLPKEYAYIGAAMVGLVVTVRSREAVRWLALAFVTGAVVSVGIGMATGSVAAAGAGEGLDPETSRFGGGSGDPNYLAAMLVPALMLAGGLSVRASTRLRVALGAAVLVIAVGLAATQSRGGLIALVVAFAAALALMREQRRLVLGAAGVALAGLLAFFSAYPGAWERIIAVRDNGSGSGRTGIWSVAFDIVGQHPFVGVGLNQFSVVSPTYVQRPGSLGGATGLIVDQQIVVHNVYLQLWAETGVIGLALFLGLALMAITSGLRAASIFDALGDPATGALARSVVVAVVAVLAGSVFLSNLLARQLWVLLALGPILAGVASRSARASVQTDVVAIKSRARLPAERLIS